MKPTLLILAAGMGSRYGGLKQIDGLGPHGETIIEYSIYDAIQSGFGKVVFVIRKSFEKEFKEQYTGKFEGRIKVAYVFQEVNIQLPGIEKLPERSKPWGVVHAVLCAESEIGRPFAMINADDYYGKEAFQKMSKFLQIMCAPDHYAMIGYVLKNTLSKNGAVTRGICEAENGFLKSGKEYKGVEKTGDSIIGYIEGDQRELGEDSLVSMNFWGFHPNFFELGGELFWKFVEENKDNPEAEMVIARANNPLLQNGKIKVSVIPSKDQWFGVTYQEDKPIVMEALKRLTKQGQYPSPLWVF